MFVTIPMLAALASFTVAVPQIKAVATPVVSVSRVVAPVTNALQGRIVSATGEAIADARVALYVEGSMEPVATARSESDGSYKLVVPPGAGSSYTVRVIRIGYTPVTISASRPDGLQTLPQIVMRPISLGAQFDPAADRGAQ